MLTGPKYLTVNQNAKLQNTDLDQALKPRRQYNQWVANETLEDFALRHTARRARRWSFSRIANTALGTSSFLVLELLGATITINYGVHNSLWAIFVVCSLLFLSGIPVSYYATRYSVDIDLLTRGAGFGYIGSTISSLIYASFTFIFFALEAAIMASALELLLGLPLWMGYIICALVVIPLVTHGIAIISRFQLITQPLWLLLQIAPIIYIAQHPEGTLLDWLQFEGSESTGNTFNWLTFGAATTVLFALVAQIGEQVDFLRFLPEPAKKERPKWWAAVFIAGPGWVIPGAIKLVLGSILAYLLLQQGFAPEQASDPTHMYQTTFQHFALSPQLALVLAAIFVIVCQIKINVANAYAGSLAWSNFFSRLTHHHPGRVVWLVFNVTIALMLMELGVYRAIDSVLHHYSAFVLAWFGSIVADLIINKPLGFSPKHIEFKRSRLYDINPVGVGSTLLATGAGILASTKMLGDDISAFSGFIAFFLPFITAPLIAFITKGKYYLVAQPAAESTAAHPASTVELVDADKTGITCTVCQNQFDIEDMSSCPAYQNKICSLCCALETRCKDQCRPRAHIGAQFELIVKPLVSSKLYQYLVGPTGQFGFIFAVLSIITLSIFYLAYYPYLSQSEGQNLALKESLATAFFLSLILLGVIVWLFVLAQKSTRMALQETDMQTKKLSKEITAHKSTLQQLDRARKSADSANLAKSNYVTALSHELRTPLNVILGYTQLLQKNDDVSNEQKEMLSILHRNGEHLVMMIEGLLEVSKIEAGKLNLNSDQVRLDLMLDQLVKMFKQQAESKGLAFSYHCPENLPKTIKVDERRLRQILINLLSNAIKFTEQGQITFSVKYRGHVARFSITDTGYGIPKDKISTIFTPFERGEDARHHNISGSGLGLAICRQLADMMGAEIEVESEVNSGSTFTLLLQVSPVTTPPSEHTIAKTISGYLGDTKSILVIDDNKDHRRLLADLLTPIGFTILEADDTDSALLCMEQKPDLVLLDVRLGATSGWDIAKALRDRFNRLPIIMASANARGFYNSKPSKRIHDDYLEKPLQLDALMEKVGALLNLEWVYKQSQAEDVDHSHSTNTTKPINAINPTSYESAHKDLIQFAKIGHLNGILTTLDHMESNQILPHEMTQQMRKLAKQFDFDGLLKQIAKHSFNPTAQIHHDDN